MMSVGEIHYTYIKPGNLGFKWVECGEIFGGEIHSLYPKPRAVEWGCCRDSHGYYFSLWAMKVTALHTSCMGCLGHWISINVDPLTPP